MNRRELLKFSLLSPLLSLFKNEGLSKTDICNEALRRIGRQDPTPIITMEDMASISETTGTSGGDDAYYREHWVYEKDYEIKALIDPTSIWAKEMAKETQEIMDDAIIKCFRCGQ